MDGCYETLLHRGLDNVLCLGGLILIRRQEMDSINGKGKVNKSIYFGRLYVLLLLLLRFFIPIQHISI